MGNSLHLEIPNVEHKSLYFGSFQLGRIYENWDEFISYYDKLEDDSGWIFRLALNLELASFERFVKDLKEHNDLLVKNHSRYALSNSKMNLFDELVELAIENRYEVRFITY